MFDTLDSDRLRQLRSVPEDADPGFDPDVDPGTAAEADTDVDQRAGEVSTSSPPAGEQSGPMSGSSTGTPPGSTSGVPSDSPSGSGNSPVSDSVILYRNGRLYMRSSAALRIAAHLRFPWPLAVIFLAVPRVIRDAIYDWIARNRYRWFGKRETCFLPDGGMKKRFL